jgi:hypothetical protein
MTPRTVLVIQPHHHQRQIHPDKANAPMIYNLCCRVWELIFFHQLVECLVPRMFFYAHLLIEYVHHRAHSHRAVVYLKPNGAKYAYSPTTRATFWLLGTRLNDLPGAPESEAATGTLLIDEGKLRQQVDKVRQKSLALERRTATFLSDSTPVVVEAPLAASEPGWVDIGHV